MRRPSLRKKNAGELVQKLVPSSRGGRKDARYEAAAITRPIRASATLTRRSPWASVLASQTLTAAPAVRKPAHGNSVNVLLPPAGRRYHSIGSGRAASHGVARTRGVSIAAAIVTAANSAARPASRRPAYHSAAETIMATPITFRMSTFSSERGNAPPLMIHD
jgi:hypothetical protein